MLTGRLGRALHRASSRCCPCRARRPDKYWPPVRRIDQAYGDRNLVCSCPPPEAYAEDEPAHRPVALVPDRTAGAPDELGTTADVVGERVAAQA